MKRRSFLRIAGAAGMFPFINSDISAAKSFNNDIDSGDDMFLDSDKLKYRNQNRSEVVCQNGIVCSSQPLASFAGINILMVILLGIMIQKYVADHRIITNIALAAISFTLLGFFTIFTAITLYAVSRMQKQKK